MIDGKKLSWTDDEGNLHVEITLRGTVMVTEAEVLQADTDLKAETMRSLILDMHGRIESMAIEAGITV